MDAQSIADTIYDEVQPNPTCANVYIELEIFEDNICNYIGPFAGGSL
jgi:alcohol dehydrogenase